MQRTRFYYYLICFIRLVAGTLFIPSGLLKIQGYRFSMYCPQMYSGSFFYELYQTGMYWRFLGFCQLITALLLFSQRCTAFSTLLFFSICVNIFVYVAGAGLSDKTIIMIPVLVIALALIIWDWSRIRILFSADSSVQIISLKKQAPVKVQIIGIVLYILLIIFFILTDKQFYLK